MPRPPITLDRRNIIQVTDRIAWDIGRYCIGLIRLRPAQGKEGVSNYLGSGSLVEIDGQKAILTASHVAKKLKEGESLGLALFEWKAESPRMQSTTIDEKYIDRVYLDGGGQLWDGPDLCLLKLPDPIAASIGAICSYRNMSKHRDEILQEPIEHDKYFWCIAGVAGEKVHTIGPPSGFEKAIVCPAEVVVGFVNSPYADDQCDYLDFKVRYNGGYDGPGSYGGYSGGGLWRVGLVKVEDKIYRTVSVELYGVMFHQSEIENGIRVIKCNGPQVIYRDLIDHFREKPR